MWRMLTMTQRHQSTIPEPTSHCTGNAHPATPTGCAATHNILPVETRTTGNRKPHEHSSDASPFRREHSTPAQPAYFQQCSASNSKQTFFGASTNNEPFAESRAMGSIVRVTLCNDVASRGTTACPRSYRHETCGTAPSCSIRATPY